MRPRESRIWMILLVLMPFLGMFSAWVTGFVQTFPPSSSPFGLPFPWKFATYAYSGAWCPGPLEVTACKILGFSLQTVIDTNAFAIDATLFAAVGYSLLMGAYVLTSGFFRKGELFYGRTGSLFYYSLIPVLAVFAALLTGLRAGIPLIYAGFPLGWRPVCPVGLGIPCGITSYSGIAFALDVLFFSIGGYGLHFALGKNIPFKRAGPEAKSALAEPR